MDERGLISLIAADATVQSVAGTKIYSAPAPQDVQPPFVTYFLVSGTTNQRMDGTVKSDRLMVQIDCFANDTSTVKALAEAIRSAVQPYVRNISGFRDMFEPDLNVRRVSLDIVYHANRS